MEEEREIHPGMSDVEYWTEVVGAPIQKVEPRATEGTDQDPLETVEPILTPALWTDFFGIL